MFYDNFKIKKLYFDADYNIFELISFLCQVIHLDFFMWIYVRCGGLVDSVTILNVWGTSGIARWDPTETAKYILRGWEGWEGPGQKIRKKEKAILGHFPFYHLLLWR